MKSPLLLLPCLLFSAPVFAGSPASISGAVAYSEVMRFDYDRTGEVNNVQFWAKFEGRAAMGRPDAPGSQPEEGLVTLYLRDVDSGEAVQSWLEFSMAIAPRNPGAMSNITIEGRTARFEANGVQWIIVDGGEGYEHDSVTVDDGVRKRQPRLYAGNLRVQPEGPKDASK